jgi:hypothetical protein
VPQKERIVTKTREQMREERDRAIEMSDLGWKVALNLISSIEGEDGAELKTRDLREAITQVHVVDAVRSWIAAYEPDLLDGIPTEFEDNFLVDFIETLRERLD